MKTKLFIVAIAVVSTLSQISFARGRSGSFEHRKPVLSEVKWMGTLRCANRETEVAHKKDHKCDLEFVNAETDEAWEVRENPALTALHEKSGRDAIVHIDALRSPRYLLGGSYVQIKKVETIPLETAVNSVLPESTNKQTHVCALDTSSVAN